MTKRKYGANPKIIGEFNVKALVTEAALEPAEKLYVVTFNEAVHGHNSTMVTARSFGYKPPQSNDEDAENMFMLRYLGEKGLTAKVRVTEHDSAPYNSNPREMAIEVIGWQI